MKELLSGRRSSRPFIVVSDLEVLDVSVVELTGPNLRRGRIVLPTGASLSRSSTSVLCPGSLELRGLWITAKTDPRRVSRLEGTKVENAGSFVVSSFFSTHVSKSSNSTPSSRSWKTRFNQVCPSILSKWIPSVVTLTFSLALSSCSISMRIIRRALRLARFLPMLFHLITLSLCLLPADISVLVLIGTVQTVSTAQLNFCQRVGNRHTIIDSHCASSSSEPLVTLFVPTRIIIIEFLPGFF